MFAFHLLQRCVHVYFLCAYAVCARACMCLLRVHLCGSGCIFVCCGK